MCTVCLVVYWFGGAIYKIEIHIGYRLLSYRMIICYRIWNKSANYIRIFFTKYRKESWLDMTIYVPFDLHYKTK